jgi:hypothetical protein
MKPWYWSTALAVASTAAVVGCIAMMLCSLAMRECMDLCRASGEFKNWPDIIVAGQDIRLFAKEHYGHVQLVETGLRWFFILTMGAFAILLYFASRATRRGQPNCLAPREHQPRDSSDDAG